MFFAADSRRVARMALQGKWSIAVLVTLVAFLLGGILGGFNYQYQINDIDWRHLDNYLLSYFQFSFAMCYALLTFIIGGAVQLGLNLFNIEIVLGGQPRFAALFDRFHVFAKALGLRLYCYLFIWLWSLLLFIPGIIAAYRYSMAAYLMAENPDLGICEAVNMSKQMMMGHKSRLFCLHFSFIGWYLLGAITFGIAFIWVTPYFLAANAAFYLNLGGRVQQTQYGQNNNNHQSTQL